MSVCHYVEPAITMDMIGRMCGGNISIKQCVKVDDVYKAAGSETYSDGPWILFIFQLQANHGAKGATLSVYVDGSETAVHSAICVVGTPNTNYLVGNVPGTSVTNSVGTIIGASSIKLAWSTAFYYGWQLYQFDIV